MIFNYIYIVIEKWIDFRSIFFYRKYKVYNKIHIFKIKVKTSIFIYSFLNKIISYSRNYPLRNVASRKFECSNEVKLSADFVFRRAIPAFAR